VTDSREDQSICCSAVLDARIDRFPTDETRRVLSDAGLSCEG
jgi:hypothetical protein